MNWSPGMARSLIERWQASGMTREAFCRSVGVAVSSFDYWRRKVATLTEKDDDRRSEVRRAEWIEVVSDGATNRRDLSTDIEVEIGGEILVRFPTGIDAEFLGDLIRRLRSRT